MQHWQRTTKDVTHILGESHSGLQDHAVQAALLKVVSVLTDYPGATKEIHWSRTPLKPFPTALDLSFLPGRYFHLCAKSSSENLFSNCCY